MFVPWQAFDSQLPPVENGTFITGSNVRPYARSTQVPIRMLENISPVELASCVPFIRITRIDPKSGKPVEGAEPIAIDLVGGPRFGEAYEKFAERSLVSLKSLNVKSTLSYGTLQFYEIEMSFRVHKPDILFNRESGISWKGLLEEGTSHSLEYGWTADPKVVQNEIFNGLGFHDPETGLVIGSTKTVLFVVYKYNATLLPSGEVDVVISSQENGDLALREASLGDHIPLRRSDFWGGLDKDLTTTRSSAWLRGLRRMIAGLPKLEFQKHGVMIRLGDILNTMVASPVISACKSFGYSGVDFYAGNFNERAESQSKEYGGRDLSGKSIADFLVPEDVLIKSLTDILKVGKHIQLLNFIKTIVSVVNSENAWAEPQKNNRQRANVEVRTTTYKDRSESHRLVFHVIDRIEGMTPFLDDERLALDQQSKEQVFAKLTSKNVPILEFGRGKSVILGASFDMQLDPLLQSILIERAFNDRKNRIQSADMSDVDSRSGKSLPREIIPFSILQGEITMIGNFVLESLGAFWIDYFGASQISGMYRVLEKTDIIEPGKFRTSYNVIGDGTDPLNTRRRRTDEEIAEAERIAAETRAGKSTRTRSGNR